MTFLRDNVRLRELIDGSDIAAVNESWLHDELFAITLNGLESHFLDHPYSDTNPGNSSVLHVLGRSIEPTGPPASLTITAGRNDLGDIDVDIEDSRRGEVKAYLQRKFKNVASISTFTYFKDKGVIRDSARVMGVPLADVNKALKGIETYEDFTTSATTQWFRKQYPDVLKVSDYLRGRIRNVGMHAAGVIVASEPINSYAPIETRKDKDDDVSGRIPVVAYDMEEAESVGLVKIDALGLKTLSVIHDCLDVIDEDIDINKIPLDDTGVYRMLSEGRTRGVFQCSAPPYTKLIERMGVENFDHLVASNALVRPGAMNTVGGDYVAIKNGERSPVKIHPIYDEITGDTYGKVLYQEQVLLLCSRLAGMSESDADRVRKIIGKKKDVSEFDKYRTMFVEGASQHISIKLAEKLWHDFEAHSNYSFNKSHAVAYSMVSYITAWLKYNYPRQFMYATLRNESDRDALVDHLIECKNLEIPVYMPHVNDSEKDFSLRRDGIMFGLSNVKYISDRTSSRIIAGRPFNNANHFVNHARGKGSGINSRAVEALEKIGALTFGNDAPPDNVDDYVYEYLGIPKFSTSNIDPHIMKHVRTLDEFDPESVMVSFAMVKSIRNGNKWSLIDLVDSGGSAGVFHNENTQIESGKLYLLLIGNNSIIRYIDPDELSNIDTDPFVRWLNSGRLNIDDDKYVSVAFSTRKTKKGANMGTVVLSDKNKNLYSAIVFPGQYARALDKLRPGKIVDVVIKKDGDSNIIKEIK